MAPYRWQHLWTGYFEQGIYRTQVGRTEPKILTTTGPVCCNFQCGTFHIEIGPFPAIVNCNWFLALSVCPSFWGKIYHLNYHKWLFWTVIITSILDSIWATKGRKRCKKVWKFLFSSLPILRNLKISISILVHRLIDLSWSSILPTLLQKPSNV